MKIRHFQKTDTSACLLLFESNMPKYFHSSELNLFADCLKSTDFLPPRVRYAGGPKGCMYVVEEDEQIVGCGGWFLHEGKAVLSWGMVHRSRHGSGIGQFLLSKRLAAIRADGRANVVQVRTTPDVQGFYEHYGFIASATKTNGLVIEVPLVELSLTL